MLNMPFTHRYVILFLFCLLGLGAISNPVSSESSGLVDSLQHPAEITLLTEQPLYNRFGGMQQTATLSPQTVKVKNSDRLYVDSGWLQIETWMGDQWLYLGPRDYTRTPPRALTLWSSAPFYAERDFTVQPREQLEPQTLEVLDADPDWFTQERYHGLKVRAQDGQTGWVNLPLDRIGSLSDVDLQLYVMWSSPALQEPLPQPEFSGNLQYVANKQYVHAIKRFESPTSTFYQIELPTGKVWLQGSALAIVEPVQKTLELNSNTMAFSFPGALDSVQGLLPAGPAQAFRQSVLDEPGVIWYEVHTSQGNRWVNLTYADPKGAVSVDKTLDVKEPFTLSLYPYVNWGNYASMTYKPQPVHVTSEWQDGPFTWLRVDTNQGMAWLRTVQLSQGVTGYDHQDVEEKLTHIPPGVYLAGKRSYLGEFLGQIEVHTGGTSRWFTYIVPPQQITGFREVHKQVTLPDGTELLESPTDTTPSWQGWGVFLSAQTVTVKGEWTQEHTGWTYALIDSYVGDAWVRLP